MTNYNHLNHWWPVFLLFIPGGVNNKCKLLRDKILDVIIVPFTHASQHRLLMTWHLHCTRPFLTATPSYAGPDQTRQGCSQNTCYTWVRGTEQRRWGGSEQCLAEGTWRWYILPLSHCFVPNVIDTAAGSDTSNQHQVTKTDRWLSARLQYLRCVSTGDTAVLHWAIEIVLLVFSW